MNRRARVCLKILAMYIEERIYKEIKLPVEERKRGLMKGEAE